MKSEISLPPVFLKTPKRVVGLLHVHFLAMMVSALIERELRMNMQRTGVESIPIYPKHRESRAPTSPRVFELFAGANWFRHVGRREHATYLVELAELQKQVLGLLGVARTLYRYDVKA